MKIGLLGGSFNPAHDGHRTISLVALKKLGLDRVWWLVTPQNPLKSADDTADYDVRLEHARRAARHPRIVVSDFERRMNVTFTFETLRLIRMRYSSVRFVWLMGADNLVSFSEWENWREIARLAPIAVFARPGSKIRAPFSHAARCLSRHRLDEEDAKLLATTRPPAWVYLTDTLHPASSTAIREKRSVESETAAH